MQAEREVPVGRYALTALLGAAAVVGVVLLVRPFIFSFATARDDANYPVMPEASLSATPMQREIVLSESQGIPGEIARGEHASIMVVVTRLPTGAIAVVNAWSPENDCAVGIGSDRLVDCEGSSWTYAGFPITPDTPALIAFPTTVRSGAVIVDFTHPLPAGS